MSFKWSYDTGGNIKYNLVIIWSSQVMYRYKLRFLCYSNKRIVVILIERDPIWKMSHSNGLLDVECRMVSWVSGKSQVNEPLKMVSGWSLYPFVPRSFAQRLRNFLNKTLPKDHLEVLLKEYVLKWKSGIKHFQNFINADIYKFLLGLKDFSRCTCNVLALKE